MSYDLIGLRIPPGQTVQEFYEDEAREEDDSPPTAAEREAMERLAAAIAQVDPRAERWDGEDMIEYSLEAIQVSLYAREAGIAIPYWFDGGEADAVLAEAMEYARVLAEAGGYTVYDPQTDQVVETTAVDPAARSAYDGGREVVKELAQEDRPRRRWWQRR